MFGFNFPIQYNHILMILELFSSNNFSFPNFTVSSFNDPIRALYMLRAGKQSFDLIVTALYMPKMDGFELTRRVNDEFELPVISESF